jgi:hypothetical protein
MYPATRAPSSRAAQRLQPIWTPAAFRARALELMETRHAGWWSGLFVAQGLSGAGRLAWVEVAVESVTMAGAWYRALRGGERRGQPCFHAGVAIAYGRAGRGGTGNGAAGIA